MRADAADDHGQCRAGPGDDQDGGQGNGESGRVVNHDYYGHQPEHGDGGRKRTWAITDTVPAATLAHLTALMAQDGGSADLG